ncbi:hypothetical protein EVAR_79454_1 [Eumeta japonica]|uniref:Uncharacterized protein n=1 Tax=Eumeta variegata TaxID=151549 RepID=A0A4C1UF23_EUMVA|nr:hypothetical protein EVAR_79454_1 [Eumeta japonica]
MKRFQTYDYHGGHLEKFVALQTNYRIHDIIRGLANFGLLRLVTDLLDTDSHAAVVGAHHFEISVRRRRSLAAPPPGCYINSTRDSSVSACKSSSPFADDEKVTLTLSLLISDLLVYIHVVP